MIRDELIQAIRAALGGLGIDPIPDRIEIERPANRDHGDWSSNVALASSKAAGRNPRELGTELAAALSASPPAHVAKIDVAGPGFVNFHLADSWLHEELRNVVAAGTENFGDGSFGEGQHVNVEFVSANPNKPLHGGHARGAIYGDSIARLFEACGYEVTREYYLNDRGVQMGLFAESLAARKRGEAVPEEGYQGEYLIEWAAEMPDDADVFEWGYERALRSHRETLERISVHHDVWFSERSMVESGAIQATLDELGEKGVSFVADDATWLRSTDYGDDKDRVLIKSNGEPTYLLPDIAYHRDKFSRCPKLVNVWGADHHGYVPRMKAAMSALGHTADDLEVVITQMVDLERDGEPFRQSGRLGDMVALDDIVDAIGPDATRFSFLAQSIDTRQTVDLDALAEQSMDNPVYYVQYAHARIHSLVRKASEEGVNRAGLESVDLSVLSDERELEMLRVLTEFADIVAVACREHAPHKIATWLRELAAAFHGFYHDCRVVGDDVSVELSQARLWLCEAARIGLHRGLWLLGVSAPESM